MLEVHACIAKDAQHFRHLVVYLIHNFRSDHILLEKYASRPFFASPLALLFFLVPFFWTSELSLLERKKSSQEKYYFELSPNTKFTFFSRRGALIVRRLCVLLDAERVFREFSTILEGEDDLHFASVMVQVFLVAKILFLLSFKSKEGKRKSDVLMTLVRP